MTSEHLARLRLKYLGAFAGVALCSTAVLYACDSDEPATPTGSDAGVDASRVDANTDPGFDSGDNTPKDAGSDASLGCDFSADAGGTANPYCHAPACDGIGQNTDYQLNTGNPVCNNCVRSGCCAQATACFGNGKPPGEGGVPTQNECTALDGCTFTCIGADDAGGCRATCESQYDAGIVAIHTAWGNCANTKCENYPKSFNDGGELCGPQL